MEIAINGQGELPAMHVRNKFLGSLFFILLMVSLPASSGFSQQDRGSNAHDTVIASTDNWRLTYGDVQRILGYYPEKQQALLRENPKKIFVLVERMVQTRVLSDMAEKDNFQNRPDIREQLELFMRDKLASAYVKAEVVDRIKPTPEDIELYYRSNKKKYVVPAKVKMRHILIRLPAKPSGDELAAAEVRIKTIMDQVKNGGDFATAAASFSEDPGSRVNGGELGWLTRDKLDPAFAKAAFSARKGEIIGPVRSRYGLHIIQVEERRPARQLKFEQVKDRVRMDYIAEVKAFKVRDFISGAEKKAHAEVHREKLMELLLNN